MDKRIPIYMPDLSGNEKKYVIDCIETGWISSLGSYVRQFEEQFAEYCRVKHAISVANGTVALHLALISTGIGPGDEVIVPSLTFVATANVVRHAGAKPVFVDVDESYWTLDPIKLEEKITSRTKAIIPVHLYGHPADMDRILKIAEAHQLIVIEDAAEAHGAEYKGKKVGGLGNLGCFSFYGNKTLTTGEGGMVLTDDDNFAERARFLKDHGMSKERRYWHPEIGYNYRMTNLQAAVGVAQLERLDSIVSRKREIAAYYRRNLGACAGIDLHPEAEWAKNSYWMYSIVIKDDFGLSRDELMVELEDKNIETRPFFYPMHQLPPYREKDGNYPASDRLSQRGMNLPSYPGLSDHDIDRICSVIRNYSG